MTGFEPLLSEASALPVGPNLTSLFPPFQFNIYALFNEYNLLMTGFKL